MNDFHAILLQSTLDDTPMPRVQAKEVKANVALSPSRLPGLLWALNPYGGCEHDCVYCYAPYTTKKDPLKWGCEVGYRANLPELLAKELPVKKGMIGLGTVTDPWQPLEATLSLTRKCLMEIAAVGAPVSALTKSDLIIRDIDLLAPLPRSEVGISITCLDADIAAKVEPYAASPLRRLEALRRCKEAGINTFMLLGPLLPFLTLKEADELLAEAAVRGCKRVMVDRYRPRPGIEARLAPAGEFDWNHPKVNEHDIFELCRKHKQKCESAF
ncbi:MAG: radical SAM protein [Methanomassiliicoccales archaeon]